MRASRVLRTVHGAYATGGRPNGSRLTCEAASRRRGNDLGIKHKAAAPAQLPRPRQVQPLVRRPSSASPVSRVLIGRRRPRTRSVTTNQGVPQNSCSALGVSLGTHRPPLQRSHCLRDVQTERRFGCRLVTRLDARRSQRSSSDAGYWSHRHSSHKRQTRRHRWPASGLHPAWSSRLLSCHRVTIPARQRPFRHV